MRFDIDFKIFLRCLVRHKLVSGQVLMQINSTQGVRDVVDMFPFLSRRTIQDGTHHIPSYGLGVEAVVVPNNDAMLAFQQFEGGIGVLFYAFVMVVAIDEDHIVFAEMWCEIKGLGITIDLLHVGQVLAEEAVQVGILLVASEFYDVLFG